VSAQPIKIDKPDLSVLIPTYNRAMLLHRAITSVLEQTHKNLEVIVCDDGSTDRTAGTVYALQRREGENARLRYFQLEHSGLPAHVVKCGWNHARGDWVAWLSDDDFWEVDVAAEHFAFIATHPDYGATYPQTRWERFQWGYQPVLVPDTSKSAGASGCIYERLLEECFTAPMIARRALYQLLNTDPNILGVEDWDLSIRIARETKVGALRAVYVKRDTDDGLRLKLGVVRRLQASVEMMRQLGEWERVEALASQLYWETKPVKLPFCLRWTRWKHYGRRLKAILNHG